MPIANCIMSPECYLKTPPSDELIALWSQYSDQSDEHMTINFLKREQQIGNPYQIMATLFLPSVWSSSTLAKLQLGLAKALAEFFDVNPLGIHVMTTVVPSGHVVENGETQEW